MRIKYILPLLLVILVLTSCKNNDDVSRAIETFFILLIQIISFILLGIPSLILIIVNADKPSPNTGKIIGGILLSIFVTVTISTLLTTIEINPKRPYIYFTHCVDLIITLLSLFYLFKNIGKSTQKNVTLSSEINDLDNIIDSEPIVTPIKTKPENNIEIEIDENDGII